MHCYYCNNDFGNLFSGKWRKFIDEVEVEPLQLSSFLIIIIIIIIKEEVKKSIYFYYCYRNQVTLPNLSFGLVIVTKPNMCCLLLVIPFFFLFFLGECLLSRVGPLSSNNNFQTTLPNTCLFYIVILCNRLPSLYSTIGSKYWKKKMLLTGPLILP